MVEIASKSQLRMSFLRWALFIVPAILLCGWLASQWSGAGMENRWYAALGKPDWTPAPLVFPIVWNILYIMMGLSLAMILHARGAKGRGLAIGLFLLQLAGNFLWSPLFFKLHQVTNAFYLIVAILVLTITTTFLFARIRKVAAWLLVPYMVWLSIAAMLNFQIDRMNPNAETLVVPAASTQIPI
jgi:translocator protein